MQHQEAFADQPLVQCKNAIQALCAVSREHQHNGFVVDSFEDRPYLLIQPAVVIGDDILVSVARTKPEVLFVEIFPVPVL